MNACLNWPERLASRFDRSSSAEPEELAEALAHFDICPACRREACRIDPTLIFRRLPAAALDFDVEAERMRLAVAGMRASERVLTRETSPLSRRLRSQGARWALAAGLAAMALVFGGQGGQRGRNVLAEAAPRLAGRADSLAVSAGSGGPMPARLDSQAPAAVESAVEDLGRPDARIYQLDGERLSVVMIVDEKLDV